MLVLSFMFIVSSDWAPSHTGKATAKANRIVSYFYYYEPYDEFGGYITTANMITNLEDMYGYLVDTNPLNNGSLVGAGYFDNSSPHDDPPSVNLYVHMPSGAQALKKAR